MPNELGDIRRSQVITSYGPGAIVDFRAGGFGGAGISVVAGGLEEWDRWAPPPGLGNAQTVYEARLEKQLGVEGFRLPPVAPQVAPGVYSKRAGKLVGVRFPQWLQCPGCHLIRPSRRWAEDAGDPALYCADCSRQAGGRNRVHVVPVRFIVMCSNGHLDEFPWEWWVKHLEDCPKQHDLKLEGSATAGLAGLLLTCLGCGEQRSLEGCFGPSAIPEDCFGRRPWLGIDADETCEAKRRVVQRGASNLYFSAIESTLDIPPWSDELQKKIGMRWAILEKAPDKPSLSALVHAFRLGEITGRPEQDIVDAIEDRVARLNAPDRNLRWEEYQQFVQHKVPFGENTEFEIRPVSTPPELQAWIQSVVRVTRLREVRALHGFTRVFPPFPGQTDGIAKLSARPTNWLPAVENRGEGIFLQLRLDRLSSWEERPLVTERASEIQGDYRRSWQERGRPGQPTRLPTARLLLVHSLAHALIRQLSLTCGYGSASLRERLYVDSGMWDMAGLLIYTSSPDADGTLGGLARQGEPANLVGIIEDALTNMKWCSSDPLCIHGIHALSEAANGAACHSCLLASETSCEEFNVFLDRATLVGTPTVPEMGFFRDYVDALAR
jgi:uncharacterized protein DUF1998